MSKTFWTSLSQSIANVYLLCSTAPTRCRANWECMCVSVSVYVHVYVWEAHSPCWCIKSIIHDAVFSVFFLFCSLLSFFYHYVDIIYVIVHEYHYSLFFVYFFVFRSFVITSKVKHSAPNGANKKRRRRRRETRERVREKFYGCKVIWLLTSYLTKIDA